MRKILSILLALVFVFSFGIMAFAGNGDGTGGGNGDGTGGGNQSSYDATVNGPGTLTITCTAASNTYDIDSVNIPFSIHSYPTGGLKHLATTGDGNIGQTINSSTVVLTCNGSVVSGFSPVVSSAGCSGDKHNGYFSIYINSSLLKAGSSYTLTIKAGASWENQPKNHAVLNSDYSYSFSVAADAAPVETTTAESKQNSPLTTKSSSGSGSSKDTTKSGGSGAGKAAEKTTSNGKAAANEKTTLKENTKADETTTAVETDESTTAAAGAATTKAAKAEKSGDKASPETAADGDVRNDDSKNGTIAAAIIVTCAVPMGAAIAYPKIFRKK